MVSRPENVGAKVGHGSGGMRLLRAALKSSTFTLSGDREGGRIFTVDLYRKVRLACAEGMSQREAARHFNISRDSVGKMMAFSVPPGYRRTAPVKRPKLDAFTGIIDGWLDGDREVHRKQRHTAKRVFERLRPSRQICVANRLPGNGRTRVHRRLHDREGLHA
jgi:hypothetical protein